MEPTLGFKLLLSLVILAAGALAGVVPILTQRFQKSPGLLCHGNYLAKGIFLGAGLTHFLPSAIVKYALHYPKADATAVLTLCACTAMIIQFTEEALHKVVHDGKLEVIWLPYFLMTILSVHAALAGVALGLSADFSVVLGIFVAIIAHKSAAAFSLSINMLVRGVTRHNATWLVLVFSIMTPLGILGGGYLTDVHWLRHSTLFEAYFDTIAAGTFIYIAMTSKLEHRPMALSHTWLNMFWSSAGFVLMASLAHWV